MSDDLKRKAKNIIQERNLCSYMNDTKWNELRNAMINEMPFPPPFTVKYLFETEFDEEDDLQKDVYYLGDWEYGLSDDGKNFECTFLVEWIKIRPRYLKRRGALIESEIIDAEKIFVELLEKYNIPYEKSKGVFCIYGYR